MKRKPRSDRDNRGECRQGENLTLVDEEGWRNRKMSDQKRKIGLSP